MRSQNLKLSLKLFQGYFTVLYSGELRFSERNTIAQSTDAQSGDKRLEESATSQSLRMEMYEIIRHNFAP